MNLRSGQALLGTMFMRPVALAAGESTAPTAIETTPASDSTTVDPATTELRVTFDKPMSAGSRSWAYENRESRRQSRASAVASRSALNSLPSAQFGHSPLLPSRSATAFIS